MSELELPPSKGLRGVDIVKWFTDRREKLCVLPWLNIHTNPDGKIKLCCNIHLDHFVHAIEDGQARPFNLGYDDIEDIWNSTYMFNARQLHHSNEGCNECEKCYELEKTTGHSPKIGQNALWDQRLREDQQLRFYLNDKMLGGVTRPTVEMMPVSLELRLGNQCNLQCVTCWGMSSSLIHDERKEVIESGVLETRGLTWLKNKWVEDSELVNQTDLKNWFETDLFYSNFKKMAANLKRLYTTGGEPTVIKANYKMFQMLLDEGNTDCRIEFTTNMTTWNPEFYKRLEQFNNVEIQMSMDGIDDIGEYIRYPSNFTKVKENLFKAAELASSRPGWTIKCFTVLQALNFKHLAGIWELLNDAANMYNVNIDWWPITLNYPEHLSLNAVPQKIREQAVDELSEARNQYIDEIGRFYISHHTWTTLTDSIINAEFDLTHQKKLISFVGLNDQIRNLDGELLFADVLKPVKPPKQNVFTR